MTADRTRLPAIGPDPLTRFPPIVKHEADGLRSWSIEHHELPVVSLVLLFPLGSAADPSERHGLASLTADLLDEGTLNRDSLALHDALARIGAQLDIEVTADSTALSLLTLTKFADEALALLFEVAVAPRLDPVDFARVRDIRVNRVRQLRDVPPAVAERLLLHRLYGPHPYGHGTLGSEPMLLATSLSDAQAFHTRLIGAPDITLISVGDIEPDAWAERVERAWAGDADRSAHRPDMVDLLADLEDPPAHDPRIALVARPGAAQSEVRVGLVGASRSTPDYATLAVLNTALGGSFVSRINLKLREEKGFTYGARSGFEFRRGRGPFSAQASVQTDATAEAVSDILREMIDIGDARPVTAEELARAQAALTRGYPRSFETPEQVARAALQLALHQLPDDYFDRFVSDVKGVTSEAVTAAAQRYLLQAGHPCVVVVGDREATAGPLAALGRGAPVEYPVDLDSVVRKDGR